jgi:hypothetical protein
MKSKINSVSVNFLAFSAFINTLIITPFFNKDGMIIPKLILMCVVSMYFLPIVVLNCKYFFNSRIEKVLFFLQCAGLLHSLVVLFISSAPLEQQFFGRTGRGLGLITIYSLAVVFIATAVLMQPNFENKIVLGIISSAFISSLYSILQRLTREARAIHSPKKQNPPSF